MLTVKQLGALTAADSGQRLSDGGGLFGVVRTRRDNSVTVAFSYRYRFDGGSRDLRCGTWPAHSLKDIRSERDRARAMVAAGEDPALQRRVDKLEQAERQRELHKAASERAARLTVSSLFDAWLRQDLSQRKDQGKEVERAFRKDILPVLGALPAADVTRGDIAHLLDAVVARGAKVVANHLLADLRQMYGFGIARNYVEADPTSHLRKADFGGRPRERDRVLSEQEITELAQRLPLARLLKSTELAIWIMLGTCCRVGELSRSRWSDVDLDDGSWFIPAENAKNSRPHTVYLSNFALEKFRDLHAIARPCDWVFPARNSTEPVSLKSISKQINDRQRATRLKNRSSATATLCLAGGKWTPHDLRRTGATMMGELGVRPDVIERCLNHVEHNRVKRIYQRQQLIAEQTNAWQQLGEKLASLVSISSRAPASVPVGSPEASTL